MLLTFPSSLYEVGSSRICVAGDLQLFEGYKAYKISSLKNVTYEQSLKDLEKEGLFF